MNPMGIAVDSNDDFYVADGDNHRIQNFTRTGDFITKWGSAGTGNGQFIAAHGIATFSGNSLLVVEFSNHHIQNFQEIVISLQNSVQISKLRSHRQTY